MPPVLHSSKNQAVLIAPSGQTFHFHICGTSLGLGSCQICNHWNNRSSCTQMSIGLQRDIPGVNPLRGVHLQPAGKCVVVFVEVVLLFTVGPLLFLFEYSAGCNFVGQGCGTRVVLGCSVIRRQWRIPVGWMYPAFCMVGYTATEASASNGFDKITMNG